MVCQDCQREPALVGYGAPQLCAYCWCLNTGDAPEDLAEKAATSEEEYRRLLATWSRTVIPRLLASRTVAEYYAARGYAWAREATDA